ncbi:class IV adenylate cyclase [candidate division KSB1 bacterium]
MEEIEVKILEINTEEVIKNIEDLGAKRVFEGDIHFSYFDFDDKRLSKERKILRLRKKGKISELTFKKKISKEKAKIMEEHEVIIEDDDSIRKILGGIGLKERPSAKKHRISFALDDVHFELDTFPGIPTFLEIEAKTLDILKEYVEKLGFSMDNALPWSGKDVLRHYGNL